MVNNSLSTLRKCIFCLFIFASFNLSYGQDFEVGPVKMNFTCEPGLMEAKSLTIRNHANEKQQFTLTLADLIPDTSRKVTTKSKENIRSCKDWITLNPAFLEINPNESKEVKVVMQVPNGQSNTRGAMIYISATEEQTAFNADKQMKSAINVKPRIGVKVIQSPKSNTNYKGAISDLKEITKQKDSARVFQVLATNPGDKMLDGKIYLVLSNLETAKEIKQKPVRVSIFPGEEKLMILYMPQDIPAGKYSLAAILDYGKNAALEATQMNITIK